MYILYNIDIYTQLHTHIYIELGILANHLNPSLLNHP